MSPLDPPHPSGSSTHWPPILHLAGASCRIVDCRPARAVGRWGTGIRRAAPPRRIRNPTRSAAPRRPTPRRKRGVVAAPTGGRPTRSSCTPSRRPTTKVTSPPTLHCEERAARAKERCHGKQRWEPGTQRERVSIWRRRYSRDNEAVRAILVQYLAGVLVGESELNLVPLALGHRPLCILDLDGEKIRGTGLQGGVARGVSFRIADEVEDIRRAVHVFTLDALGERLRARGAAVAALLARSSPSS